MTTALGIDIRSDAAYIVELRARGNQAAVTRMTRVPLPADAPADAVADAIAAGLHAGARQVAIAAPAAGCTVKTALLPPAKPAELAQVVRFEAASQFPLPLEEFCWDYTLTPSPAGGRQAVIVGARRVLVEAQLASLARLGITPGAVMLAPLAVAEALPPISGTAVLVVANAAWSDLCLFVDGAFQGCRSILAGAPSDPSWAERLAREIQGWSASTPIDRVIATGTAPRAAVTHLGELLGISATREDPWQDIAGISDFTGLATGGEDGPASFITALGLARAMLRGGPSLNLLPAYILEARHKRVKAAITLTVLAVIAILLAGVALVNGRALTDRRAQLQTMITTAGDTTRPERPVGNLEPVRQVIDAIDGPESDPLELLRLLSEKIPEGVSLTNFTFDRGRTLVLKGRVPTYDALTATLQAMAMIPTLQRTMLDYSTQVKDGAGYDFGVTCTLPPSTDPTHKTGRGKAFARTESPSTGGQ